KERNTLPNNSLHAFIRNVDKIGIDPTLPIIDIKDNYPKIVGSALFQQDKYVESISFSDAFLINIMLNHVKGSPLEASIPYENYQDEIDKRFSETSASEEFIYLSLWLTKGNGKIKLKDKGQLHYQADIKMTAELLETSVPMEVRTKEITQKLEKDIEQYYGSQFENLFTKM